MVDELVKRGISADRFMYIGLGGTRPLGDNSTSEGRTLNRRVEITILD
jgi:outer membrane protein OmpA-like peptidoglycan-associated protein